MLPLSTGYREHNPGGATGGSRRGISRDRVLATVKSQVVIKNRSLPSEGHSRINVRIWVPCTLAVPPLPKTGLHGKSSFSPRPTYAFYFSATGVGADSNDTREGIPSRTVRGIAKPKLPTGKCELNFVAASWSRTRTESARNPVAKRRAREPKHRTKLPKYFWSFAGKWTLPPQPIRTHAVLLYCT